MRAALAAVRAALATSLVFAAAAFLAMQLIGPRYEARISVSAPALPPVGQAGLPTGADIAVPAGSDRSGLAPALSLPERVTELLERDASGRPPGGSVTIERATASGDLSVVANATTSGEARRLAAAAASELLATDEPDPPGEATRIEDLRERVAFLESRLASLSDETGRRASQTRREELERAENELRDAWVAAEARRSAVEALRRDPSAAVPIASIEAPDLRQASEAYRRLAASIENLSATLPEAYPRLRIARLRLDDLGRELAERATLAALDAAAATEALRLRLAALEDERGRLDADARRASAADEAKAGLEGELAAARGALASLETARVAEISPEPRLAEHVSVREIQPPVWRVTGIAALTGLIVGAAGGALASALARPRPAISRRASEALPPRYPEPQAEPSGPTRVGQDASGPARPSATPRGSIPIADVSAALLTSPVSRTLVVSAGGEAGDPLALILARSLAQEDKLVLLVDLSPQQRAAGLAGIASDRPGFRDVASGAASLASATSSDEASATDIVAGGAQPQSETHGGSSEILDFARRAYDHILVDCGSLPAAGIVALADEECAILIEAAADEALADRLAELERAGLDTVIVVS